MATWQISDNNFDFTVTHSIDAPQDIVYRALADMEAYPEFVKDLISVKREGALYKFIARAAILTIPATLAVTKRPDRAIDFELVDGPLDRLSGSWLIEAGQIPEQTKVTLTIHAETGAQGEWLLRMTAKFVENKTDKLIAAFSERVLEIQRTGGKPVLRPEPAQTGGFLAWLKKAWARLYGQAIPRQTPRALQPSTGSAAGEAPKKLAPSLFREERQRQTLEALATTLLPADDFDHGVQNMGFASVVEMRSRYEAGREELYTTALDAVDVMAQYMFDKPSFVALTASERTALLDAVRQDRIGGEVWGQVKPASFFSALWEDTVFLYCTHPDTWQRVGFPGPAHRSGGYRDFDQPQEFAGQTHVGLSK